MIEKLMPMVADHLCLGLLVVTRIGALLAAMTSLKAVLPRRIQVIMAISIAVLLVPAVAANSNEVLSIPTDAAGWTGLGIAIAHEALIGMLIGTTIQLIVVGIQLGAEVTSISGGLQVSSTPDADTGQNMPSLAKFAGLMVVAVMFAGGGHRMILNVLLDSFSAMPPGQVSFHDSMMDLVIQQLGAGMSAGIRVAAPVVAALLLTNLLTGLISRTLPQLNVLAIGLSVNALALLIVTALTIGSAGLVFQDELVKAADKLNQLW